MDLHFGRSNNDLGTRAQLCCINLEESNSRRFQFGTISYYVKKPKMKSYEKYLELNLGDDVIIPAPTFKQMIARLPYYENLI